MRRMFFAICLVFTFGVLVAQPQQQVCNKSELRKEFHKLQTEEIIKELGLNEEEGAKFKEYYTSYLKELSSLQPRKLFKKADSALTEEEAQQQLAHNFERADKINAIKEKYYKKFGEVMTGKEIMRISGIEREVRQRVVKQHREQRQQQNQEYREKCQEERQQRQQKVQERHEQIKQERQSNGKGLQSVPVN